MKDVFKNMMKWVLSVVICGLFVGILGNKIYYNYFEAPHLAYEQTTYPILVNTGNLNADVKIQLNDELVDNLFLTMFTIKNDGAVPLRRIDFSSEKNPLRITGKFIKDVSVDDINSTVNSKVLIEKDKDVYRILFKWINPGDEILIRVLHTKLNANLSLSGGFENIPRIQKNSKKDPVMLLAFYFPVFCIIILIFIFPKSPIYNKFMFGVFFPTNMQILYYIYIRHLVSLDPENRKSLKRKIFANKDKEELNKILNEYLSNEKKHNI